MLTRANPARSVRAFSSAKSMLPPALKKAVQRSRKRPATKKKLPNKKRKLAESEIESAEQLDSVNIIALNALTEIAEEFL
jgi:hypothetical protein